MAEWTPWDELEAERKGRWAAEAQRDRAFELLREWDRVAYPGPSADLQRRTKALIAEQQPCQRCGGDELVMEPTDPDGEPGGVPCPDCQGGAS